MSLATHWERSAHRILGMGHWGKGCKICIANALQLGVISDCFLREATQALDELLTTPEGVKKVRQMFNLCDNFDGTDTLNVNFFIFNLSISIGGAVQHNTGIDDICRTMNDSSGGTPLQRYAKVHGLPGGDHCTDVKFTDLVKSLNHTFKGDFGSMYFYY